MPRKYSILQYVPDPIADERINFGVIVFEGKKIEVRFLKNWRRVQYLAGDESIQFVKDFAGRLKGIAAGEQALPGFLDEDLQVDEERLEAIAGKWVNSIQFTSPKTSMQPARQLLSNLVERYLIEPRPRKRAKGRRVAARNAARGIKMGLELTVGENIREVFHRNHNITGEVEPHSFDVVVGNGRPAMAAQGLSFAVRQTSVFERLIDATAWMMKDVREKYTELPLVLSIIPPKKRETESFERAAHIFKELEVPMLEEKEIEPWVVDIAKELKGLS